MILDRLEHARNYTALHAGFAAAVDFLLSPGVLDFPEGRHAIDGEDVYAIVHKGPGRSRDAAFLETHRKYIDIQAVLKGCDTMGWKPASLCLEAEAQYDADKDIQFFREKPDVWIPVHAGSFAVFFPQDAHLPLVSEEYVHKIIIKIAV